MSVAANADAERFRRHEQVALDRIATLEEPDRLRRLMENARTQGASRVEAAAFARLCAVQPSAEPGSLAFDVWRSIFALEEMLREERGKTTRLSRTRQKIARDGEIKTCADLTLRATPTEGFEMLVARGHPDLLFEAVVLRHRDRFSADVIDAAERRMADARRGADNP